jgi:hypothetical protein
MSEEMEEWVAPPVAATIPVVGIQGVPIAIVAKLPKGGFLQIVCGENPLVMPHAGVQIGPGCMLAVIPPQVAVHLQKGLKEADRRANEQLIGKGQREVARLDLTEH